MQLTPELAGFLSGPVLMTIATRDAANRPMVGRGSGGRAVAGPPDPFAAAPPDGAPGASARRLVEVAVSALIWPETVANVRATGMLAVTFVQPADYRAFQLKGRATVRPAEAADQARADAYVAATERLLIDLGVGPDLVRYWLTARDIAVLTMEVDRVFEQTPGPRAGAVVA